MGVKFTKEQQYALEKEGNVLVSAGAGSGKTAVLSERVIHFIKNKDYHIDEFLILTFTRLAAGEMKERIRKLLLENNLDDAKYIDIADITTFDSFCNSLVKKYHAFIGVDSHFTVVESGIIEVLKRKYIKEEFENLYLNPTLPFEEFLDKYCQKNDGPLLSLILEMMKKGNNQIDQFKYYENYINHYFSSMQIDNYFRNSEKKIITIKDELMDLLEYVPDVDIPSKKTNFYNLHLEAFEEFINAFNYDSMIKSLHEFKFPNFNKSMKEYLSDEEINQYIICRDKVKKHIEKYKKYQSKEEEVNKLLSFKGIVSLVLDIAIKVEQKIQAFKKEKNAFEFIDISRLAIKLVRDYPHIQEEVRNKYKMIMIDEYQDTNDIQEEFISYIQNNNVYCVGDIKQSIYAFRNAKCEIFQNKYRLYKQEPDKGTTIDLNKNFRSRKEVLEDINEIFSKIMTLDYGQADYKKEHLIKYGNKAYLDEINEKQNNHCEIFYQDKLGDIKIIAQDIISKINSKYQVMEPSKEKWKLRDVMFKDFAIIIDRGTAFDEVVKTLSEYKIPVYVERNEDISSDILVEILKNLCILITYLRDNKEIDIEFKHAYISICRSFIFMYDDTKIYSLCKKQSFINDDVYQTLKEVIDSNIDEDEYNLLFKVIEKLQLYYLLPRVGEIKNNEIYLDYFLSLFKNMIDLDMTMSDFISYLEDVKEFELELSIPSNGNNDNVVKLINIHKSKGLEYNICYFPNLHKGFFMNQRIKQINFDSKFGFYDKSILPLYDLVYDNYTRETISERIRIFYVALTRAREKFYLFYSDPKKENYEYHIDKCTKYNEFVYLMLDEFKVNHIEVDNLIVDELIIPPLTSSNTFKVSDVTYQFKVQENVKVASKELTLGVNKEALEFGNKLHLCLEIIDFKNPDYSFINNHLIENKIKKFIQSDLLKDVNQAKIYKEYEYYDQTTKTRGIIDLFLVYQDKVVIIDYKTKNISESSYDEQIKVYKEYLSKKYPLRIEGYLYSLIDEEWRKVL